MKILYGAFIGKNNSSKILLDKINSKDKLYLENDKEKSCLQIKHLLMNNSYDEIYLFGQKPLIKNKLSIETCSKKDNEILYTFYNINDLSNKLTKCNISNYLSNNAGNSYCNHIYYYCLDLIRKYNLKTKVVFIHVPLISKFNNINDVINYFSFKEEKSETEVKFYETVGEIDFKYAVIISKYKDKWVFCKHKARKTYEIPGGRKEEKEHINQTAIRELKEETGARKIIINPIVAYSVSKNGGNETFGMLYFAEILEFSDSIDSEMECIKLFKGMPKKWTYPDIQPLLIKEYKKRKHN